MKLFLLCIALTTGAVNLHAVKSAAMTVMTDGWEFRWGDRTAGDEMRDWSPASSLTAPPGRGTNQVLWLRNRLPAVSGNEPVLYLSSAHQVMRIYLDNSLFFQWGEKENLLSGVSSHLLPLPPDYAGKWIRFRFETWGPRLGLLRKPEIADRPALLIRILRDDLPSIILALFYFLSACALLGLTLLRVLSKRYLSLGLLLIAVGGFTLCQTGYRQILFGNNSFFWGGFELGSLYLIPLAITLFLTRVMEERQKVGAFTVLFWSASLWSVGIVVAGFVSLNNLLLSLPVFRFYMMALAPALMAILLHRAWKGSREAKVITAGFMVFLLALAFDVLVSMGFIPRWVFLTQWGMLALVVFLIKIIADRVFQAWKETDGYSRQLEQRHISVLDAKRELEVLTGELDQTRRELIIQLSEVAESRSQDSGNHVRRVAAYCQVLSREYGLSHDEINTLVLVAPMHDIGKLGIPDSILKKPDSLTPEEYLQVQTHTTIGYELFGDSKSEFFRAAAIVAHEHHERFDGKGYPQGLSGRNIHIFGRIVAVADVFDTLCCDRIYQKAWEIGRVLEYMQAEAGKHFESDLIDIFMRTVDEFLSIRKTWQDIYPSARRIKPG